MDQNLGLRDKCLVYVEYVCLLSVQDQFAMESFGAFPSFGRPDISKTNRRRANGPKFHLRVSCRSLVPAEYLSLLSVWGQFGVMRYKFPVFDDLVSTFDLIFGIFVLLSLYISCILLTSKSPSRGSRPLGLLCLKCL